MPKHNTLKYYPFLDGLRAIAVLGVLLFHFNITKISGGYVGVDIFFVLSGFLITGLIASGLQQNKFSLAHFYERRCRRILPALFIVCLLSFLVALFFLMPNDFKGFAKSLKGAALFYSNMIFARTNGYFADPLSTRPLLHTWSLAVEEQFYLLYPLIFYGLYKAAKKKIKIVSFSIAGFFFASLVFNLVFITINPDKTFYILPTRAWELLTGALVFLVFRHLSVSRPMAEILALTGLICVLVSFFLYDRNTVFPGWAALLPCIGSALLIWPNLHKKTAIGTLLSNRLLVSIGLISYGLYLYHWPVLVFTRYYLDRALTFPESMTAITITFALSILSYKLIETPIRSSTFIKSRQKIFLLSFISIAVLAGLGIAGAKSGGFPARFSGSVLDYARGNKDAPDWEHRLPALDKLDENTAVKIGTPSTQPTFLLWGDSHAEAIAPAIEAHALKSKTSGLFVEYSGCLPLINVARLDHSPKNAPCEDVGEKVSQLLKHYNIRNLVLVGRWDDVYGWEEGSIEIGRPEPVIAFTTPQGQKITHGKAFAPAFQETIKRFTEKGIHLWVVEQVPPYLMDVPSGLAKAVYFGRDIKKLERPYQDVEARRKQTSDVFDRFRSQKNISFIDPADTLCPDKKTCLIEQEGHSLYRDSNHLSVYGALWVEKMLDPLFFTLSKTR